MNGEPVAIDARPSDAIALALRAQAPIFVEDRVIDHAKTVDFAPDKENAERLQKWLESLDPGRPGQIQDVVAVALPRPTSAAIPFDTAVSFR